MYDYQLEPEARAAFARLSYEDAVAVATDIGLIAEDPWNFRRSPDEPVGSHYAHRTVYVADGRGMVTFLILEHAAEMHVTRIVWMG